MKLVINDSKNAKSYQKEIAPEKATQLIGKRIGEKFEGSIAGLPGYSLQIKGGSDWAQQKRNAFLPKTPAQPSL